MKRLLKKRLRFTNFLEDNLFVKQDLLVHFVKADAITRKFILKEVNIKFLSLQNYTHSFLMIQLGDTGTFALFSYYEVKELFGNFKKSTNSNNFLEFSFTIIPSICEDCSTIAVIKNIDNTHERQHIAQVPILEKSDVALILGDYLSLTA